MKEHSYQNLSLAQREQTALQEEILQGRYGQPDDVFMTTRALAQARGVSVVTAHNILAGLCDAGFLELRGKRYFLSYSRHIPAPKAPSRLLALLIPKLNNEFFSSLADAVNTLAVKQGYQVLFLPVTGAPGEEAQTLQLLPQLGVAGIISCIPTPPENEHLYHQSPLPCVMLSHSLNTGKLSSVQVNSFSISQKVAQHLIDEGYKKFFYIGTHNRTLENDLRFTAFQMALKHQGFDLDSGDILRVSSSSRADSDRIARWLQSQTEPVGIYCYHDLIAAQLCRICDAQGKRVPQDVGIVGFDDLSVATLITPPLTTVQYRIETMADMALKLLLSVIESPDAPYDNYYIEPNLVIRKSSLLSKYK